MVPFVVDQWWALIFQMKVQAHLAEKYLLLLKAHLTSTLRAWHVLDKVSETNLDFLMAYNLSL
jgi:hypothetical protein